MLDLLKSYGDMIRNIKNPDDAMFVCGYILASIDIYTKGEQKNETV